MYDLTRNKAHLVALHSLCICFLATELIGLKTMVGDISSVHLGAKIKDLRDQRLAYIRKGTLNNPRGTMWLKGI